MTSLGTATQKMPAAFAARTPFGESSKATASCASTPSALERLEIERRRRLGPNGIAVGSADRVPADGLLEPFEVHVDPATRRAGDDRPLQAVLPSGGEVLHDAGAQLLGLDQRDLTCVAPFVQRLTVERLTNQFLQVRHRIEQSVGGADDRRPELGRQFVAVIAVEELPACA